ncbi:MAG: acyltransferase, partial [Bacteroidales bacterium]|nr:acyltransferase [Bacteroidales bacterium]
CIWEVCCIAFIFPLIVYLGASGNTTDKFSSGICKFLGDISYPLYIVHYPSMYLFYAYIGFPNTFRTPSETWIWQIVLFAGNIILAYAALKLYDEPVRKWLSKK